MSVLLQSDKDQLFRPQIIPQTSRGSPANLHQQPDQDHKDEQHANNLKAVLHNRGWHLRVPEHLRTLFQPQ